MADRNPLKFGETETEMAERLFSSNPISYKMDRKSLQARNLKDHVSMKLFDFLSNYSDEVLAEYIVVLVCNGKHQIQARDDLEVFLGEDSRKFVAWLWDHLSKQNHILETNKDSSSCMAEVRNDNKDVLGKELEAGRPPDLQIYSAEVSDIPLSKNSLYEPSYSPKTANLPENLQRWCPIIDPPSTEPVTERLQAERTVVSGGTDSRPIKYLSSAVSCYPNIRSGSDDECLHYGYQDQKMANIDSSATLHQSLLVPKTEVARGLRSVIAEDQQLRPLSTRNSAKSRLPSTVVDPLPHESTRPRGNVWDRLGKPHNEAGEEMRGKNHQFGLNFGKRKQLDQQNDDPLTSRSMYSVLDCQLSNKLVAKSDGPDHTRGKATFTHHFDKCRKMEHSSDAGVDLSHMNNAKRMKLHNESSSGKSSASYSGFRENDIRAQGAPPGLQGSSHVKYSHSQYLNETTTEANGSKTLLSVDAVHNSQANKTSCSQLKRSPSTTAVHNLIPVKNKSPSKSETPIAAVCVKAKHKPAKDEVLDVKSRLQQVQMDVLKLRSKQTELSNDIKPNALLGMQNNSEEDIESRTVLVTNVHFAASREAVLSHFVKCGVVAKVVMLTDTITAQPKGAAYIVFTTKDSVEKAVSLSGTSFFSRILTVMRKADAPPDFLVPSQPPGKILPPFYPQPYRKAPAQRIYTSSHLQWKREENSVPSTTNGSEYSKTGDVEYSHQ